ncbi:uncharacterized protein LOC122261570 [Penaeus japonicus]|uniref:uncharacterized protein LOC122261570 n=1 Tax=Penaeus japonicus TaxID=27405 RepID=UPI001C70B283|nr:uncharacterized protein LOC122261570 [Penaeus japonicus]
MAFDMTKFSLEMITVVLLSVCCGTSDGLIGPNGMVLSECDPYFMSWNLLEPRPFDSHGDPNTHRATRPKQGPRTPLNPCLMQFNTAPPEGTRNSLVTRTSGDEEGGSKSLTPRQGNNGPHSGS